MKHRHKYLFGILALLLAGFIGISLFSFFAANKRIQQSFLALEGRAAENFAVLTAENLHLSNAQVAALKQYDYAALQQSPENRALAEMMDSDAFATKVDYAYVMVHLPANEVKYTVTEGMADRYDAPVGTKLDIMWLLDVNVSEGAQQAGSADELNRYAYYIDADAVILGEAPSYVYNASEWGDHICGYAPLYSTEGTYIGAVGVELQTQDYATYSHNAMLLIGALMVVSLLLLSLVFFYLYRQYRRVQNERIYTDALTGICNRSYYNNRFIKQMNSLAKKHSYFAMAIADIDWFKKVNDTFGHEIGDAVLIEVSALLQEEFGKEQTVRFGGEEFVIGFWADSEAEITARFDRLFAAMAARKFSTQQLTISISLGCCYCKRCELNGWLTSGMLRAADGKLYEIKEAGRKQYRVVSFETHPQDTHPHKYQTGSQGSAQ